MLSIELIEDLARLNRTRIPEPILHAKGAGAYGIFYPYMSMRDYTKAGFLQESNIETPVFVRFSKMTGRLGTADTQRDVRGFSVRFMTEEGCYDLPGTHIPVFFIRDPRKYPDLLSALSPCVKTNIRMPEKLWTFVAENPEAMHMITWLYSDRGTLKSYRTMEGHSVHTYLWENSRKERFWVRYHWKPLLGVKEISKQEAEFLAGFDPDAASRDLYDALDSGDEIPYELCVQLIPTSQKTDTEMALLDPVCIWPESLVPMTKVGKMIVNRGVENHLEEVEKASFSPGNLVNGIELSREPLLMAMVFASRDEERYRFGNSGNRGDLVNKLTYDRTDFGNSHSSGLTDLLASGSDQLSFRLQSMCSSEKEKLIDNMAEEILFIDEKVQNIIVSELSKADRAAGASLEKWLGL